jgi:hypothetical protein
LAVPCRSHFDFHTLKPEQLHVIELPIHCTLQVIFALLQSIPRLLLTALSRSAVTLSNGSGSQQVACPPAALPTTLHL